MQDSLTDVRFFVEKNWTDTTDVNRLARTYEHIRNYMRNYRGHDVPLACVRKVWMERPPEGYAISGMRGIPEPAPPNVMFLRSEDNSSGAHAKTEADGGNGFDYEEFWKAQDEADAELPPANALNMLSLVSEKHRSL